MQKVSDIYSYQYGNCPINKASLEKQHIRQTQNNTRKRQRNQGNQMDRHGRKVLPRTGGNVRCIIGNQCADQSGCQPDKQRVQQIPSDSKDSVTPLYY